MKLHPAVFASAVALATALPIAAKADLTTTRSSQYSIQVAPNVVTGERQGAYLFSSGSGLAATSTFNTLTTTGGIAAVAGGSEVQAAAGDDFSFKVTGRTADSTVADFALSGTSPTTLFSSQTGSLSRATGGTAGALTVAANGSITHTAASASGSTFTAINELETANTYSSTMTRLVATASTGQDAFTATRKDALYEISGKGLTALTNGGTFAAASAGDAVTATVATGANADGGLVDERTEKVYVQEAQALLSATSTEVTAPGYGTLSITEGGTAGGQVTQAAANDLVRANYDGMGITAGGSNTAQSIAIVERFTVFE